RGSRGRHVANRRATRSATRRRRDLCIDRPSKLRCGFYTRYVRSKIIAIPHLGVGSRWGAPGHGAGRWDARRGYSLFAPASHPPGASTSPRPFGSEQLRLLRSSYPVARQNALEVSKPELLPEHFAPPPSVRDRASGGGRFELREDDEHVEPKSRSTPQTSKGN